MSFLDQLQSMAGLDPNGSFLDNLNTLANVKPQSTTLNYNDDGSTDITHKMSAAPVAPTQAQTQPTFAQPQVGPTIAAANGQQPSNPLNMAQPVAPQQQAIPQAPSPQLAQATSFNQGQGQGQPGVMPIPNAPVQATPMWNDYSNPSLLTQPQAQPQAVAPGAGVPTQPQANGPTAPGAQTTNVVTPQDLIGNQVFSNMLQTESGNQNFNPDGTPVTSSAGAKYAAQVMPSTAANPGFGIKPAQSDTPEEYNRVGREFHEAMRKRYGDEEKAAAAYNAGPGRVDHAIAVANANGTDWKQYLPSETKGYLQKVFANGVPQQGGMQKVSYQAPTTTGNNEHDALIDAGNDVSKLGAIAGNPQYSETTRLAAYKQMNDVLAPIALKNEASKDFQNATQTGNFMPIANEAKKDTPKGSMFRAMLYELAGAKTAAQDEYDKIGVGAKWTMGMGPDGKPMTILQAQDGRAMRAIDPATNTEITDPHELQKFNGGGMMGAKPGGANMIYDHPDGTTHLVTESTLPNGMKRYFDSTSNTWLPSAPANLRHVGQENPLEKAARTQADRERSRLENENIKATGQGAPAPFSQADIERRVSGVYNGVKGGKIAPASEENVPAPSSTQGNAPAGAGTTLNSDLESQAQAIARGEAPMPTGLGANNYRNRAIANRVYEINPGFDAGSYKVTQEGRKNWTQPNGKGAQQIQQFDRAASHAVAMDEVIDNLNNTNLPIWNKVANDYLKNTGQAAPVDFETAKKIVADEVMKTVLGSNAGTGAEREALQHDFSSANSPAQLKAVLNRARDLMGAQGTAMERSYKNSTKLDDFEGRLGPAGQQLLNQGRAKDKQIATKNAQSNLPNKSDIEAEMRRRGLIK